MKIKLVASLFTLALWGISGATTVTASGGTTGAQFVTSAGSLLNAATGSILVGSMSGNIFTQFAVADVAPPVFGASGGVLDGRWSGNAADASNTTAAPFNGLQIWFRVNATTSGGNGVAFFGSSLNFPTANAGVGDAINVAASSISTFNASLSTPGTAIFTAPDGTFLNGSVRVGVIPEPSAALLGAIGVLGLLRRRRN